MGVLALTVLLIALSPVAHADVFNTSDASGRSLSAASILGCGDVRDSNGNAVPWFQSPDVSTYYKATNSKYLLARQSVYEGPIGHKGFCGVPLASDPGIRACGVAIGQKWLTHADQSRCGDCLCVRVLGADTKCNGNAPASMVSKLVKKQFKCKVIDQCPECEGHHIDILLDGPYADADDVSGNNPQAGKVNAAWKATSPTYQPLIKGMDAKTVGVWVSEWIWADCNANCDQVFALNDMSFQAGGGTKVPRARSPVRPPLKSPVKKSPSPTWRASPKKSPSPKKFGSPKKVSPKHSPKKSPWKPSPKKSPPRRSPSPKRSSPKQTQG